MNATVKGHPAFQKTYWVNLYRDGTISGVIYEDALSLQTFGEAIPVEVRMIPVEFPSSEQPPQEDNPS